MEIKGKKFFSAENSQDISNKFIFGFIFSNFKICLLLYYFRQKKMDFIFLLTWIMLVLRLLWTTKKKQKNIIITILNQK